MHITAPQNSLDREWSAKALFNKPESELDAKEKKELGILFEEILGHECDFYRIWNGFKLFGRKNGTATKSKEFWQRFFLLDPNSNKIILIKKFVVAQNAHSWEKYAREITPILKRLLDDGLTVTPKSNSSVASCSTVSISAAPTEEDATTLISKENLATIFGKATSDTPLSMNEKKEIIRYWAQQENLIQQEQIAGVYYQESLKQVIKMIFTPNMQLKFIVRNKILVASFRFGNSSWHHEEIIQLQGKRGNIFNALNVALDAKSEDSIMYLRWLINNISLLPEVYLTRIIKITKTSLITPHINSLTRKVCNLLTHNKLNEDLYWQFLEWSYKYNVMQRLDLESADQAITQIGMIVSKYNSPLPDATINLIFSSLVELLDRYNYCKLNRSIPLVNTTRRLQTKYNTIAWLSDHPNHLDSTKKAIVSVINQVDPTLIPENANTEVTPHYLTIELVDIVSTPISLSSPAPVKMLSSKKKKTAKTVPNTESPLAPALPSVEQLTQISNGIIQQINLLNNNNIVKHKSNISKNLDQMFRALHALCDTEMKTEYQLKIELKEKAQDKNTIFKLILLQKSFSWNGCNLNLFELAAQFNKYSLLQVIGDICKNTYSLPMLKKSASLALWQAVDSLSVESVDLLLCRYSFDPNQPMPVDRLSQSASTTQRMLLQSACGTNTNLKPTADEEERALTIVRYLLVHGASVVNTDHTISIPTLRQNYSVQELDNCTPLHIACFYRRKALVDLLLSYGASSTVNSKAYLRKYRDAYSPLDLVGLDSTRGNKESEKTIIEILTELGAIKQRTVEIKQRQMNKQKFLSSPNTSVQRQINDFIENHSVHKETSYNTLLLCIKNDPNFLNARVDAPQYTQTIFMIIATTWPLPVVQQLLEQFKDINLDVLSVTLCKDSQSNEIKGFGQTILHQATRERNISLIEILLQYHARMDIPDDNGHLSFHNIFRYVPSAADIVSLLTIFKKYDSNDALLSADSDGNTLLHHAAVRGSDYILRFLLTTLPALDINAKNKKGRTPLIYVIATGAIHCLEFLKEKGALFEKYKDVDLASLFDPMHDTRTTPLRNHISQFSSSNQQPITPLPPNIQPVFTRYYETPLPVSQEQDRFDNTAPASPQLLRTLDIITIDVEIDGRMTKLQENMPTFPPSLSRR